MDGASKTRADPGSILSNPVSDSPDKMSEVVARTRCRLKAKTSYVVPVASPIQAPVWF